MKRAILLLNLGGPEKLEDVKDFLYRLFADPEIIRIRFAPLRKLVAWLISTSRHKKSQALYQKIGGGSPIRKLTNDQAARVEAGLREGGYEVHVRTTFTCSKPLVNDVIQDLYKQGVRRFLSFPLYPQYSYTTTKSALDQVRAGIEKYAPDSQLDEIRSYPVEPSFLEAHADIITKIFQKFSDPDPQKTHLIFSAHSIPEKLVTEEGDPYKDEMEKTMAGVLEKMNWTGHAHLTWQSKLGPVKWLAPATVDVIAQLGQKGAQNILVIPIAFVTDHIETLEEIDKEMRQVALESGVKEFRRTPGLNCHPLFIKSLVTLARQQTHFWN